MMKIPKIKGIIDRRILINYQVDVDVLTKYLPAPFKPKIVNGKGVVGICLIRLKNIRPRYLPKFFGVTSENGAHRIAVGWSVDGKIKEGVYIPRRDTSSLLNALAGGRIFPGVHHHANFNVKEEKGKYSIEFNSDDNTSLSIVAEETNNWNEFSIFETIECASSFFQEGAVGYSPTKKANDFDGLELKTNNWKVSALNVSSVHSSFFENLDVFPKGTVKFDNALLMKNIKHEWNSLDKITYEL